MKSSAFLPLMLLAAVAAIQGFSLMGVGYGNMAFGATVASPIPEPSVYGTILIAATIGGWWLHYRQARLVPVRVRR